MDARTSSRRLRDARITRIRRLAGEISEYTLALDEPLLFRGGQWLSMKLGPSLNRAYSFSSSPHDTDAVSFAVRLGRGEGSMQLRTLEAGDAVRVRGPFGSFVVPRPWPSRLILIAADSAVGPIRSIATEAAGRCEVVVLQDTTESPEIYADELRAIAEYRSGDVAKIVDEAPPGGALVMVAGFDEFLSRARMAIRGRTARATVRWETFGPRP